MYAAIVHEGIIVAGRCDLLEGPYGTNQVVWGTIDQELGRSRRAMKALTEEDITRRGPAITSGATSAFATAATLALGLVPRGRKDSTALETQVRSEARKAKKGQANGLKKLAEAIANACNCEHRSADEAIRKLVELDNAWCDAQNQDSTRARDCVARHLDAVAREFGKSKPEVNAYRAQRLRAHARAAIRRLDTKAGTGKSMPRVHWATLSSNGSWPSGHTLEWRKRIGEMEGNARVLGRREGPVSGSQAQRRAVRSLARMICHFDVGTLRRAHPNH